MRINYAAIGFLVSLAVSGTVFAATQTCDEIQQSKGGAAGEQCRQKQQETDITTQVTSYKATLEKRRTAVKSYYEDLTNQENFSWKDIDLQFDREQSMRALRNKELAADKSQAEEYQRQQGTLAMLKKIRQLTSTAHTQKLKRITMQRDAEIQGIDNEITTYELQLRQQSIADDVVW